MEPTCGAKALALGVIEAGVSLVTSYPGSPATAVVNQLLASTTPEQMRVEWTGNEKVAVEMAYGASLSGGRSLVCLKSVGLNIALDPLMVFNLSGNNAGLVVLVGDDPGSWGSQNEQDSRAVALATELPILEPTTVVDARLAMKEAFQLAEDNGTPVIVRFTRALALAEETIAPHLHLPPPPTKGFQDEFMRWVVLPVNAVEYHERLHRRLATIKTRFEHSSLNGTAGQGTIGIIACGFTYQKLFDLLGGSIPDELNILRLGTFHPLPEKLITSFLENVDQVLVLEENAPLVERETRNLAQKAGLTLPIYGRDSGHLPWAGELFAPQLAEALNLFAPQLEISTAEKADRAMPSKISPPRDCPYNTIFKTLLQVINQRGGREGTIIIGDPGCMVRFQDSHRLMDVKTSLGSSIAIATGVAHGQVNEKNPKKVVALSGDSGYLHSNLIGLVEAAQIGVNLLVLVLDNQTTALSGGQPHPGSGVEARGKPRQGVELVELAKAAGVNGVEVADASSKGELRLAIEAGMTAEGVKVVFARGTCPACETLR
jgi:indolepyruvate ferredoxin oxidoreductase alpha subunit